MVANAREILYAPPANQHRRVLLQGMTLTGYVRCYFHAICQPNTGYLAKGRVRLFRRSSTYLRTYAPLLRGARGLSHLALLRIINIAQGRRLAFLLLLFSSFSDQLIYGRQSRFLPDNRVLSVF